jgi:signal peptidase
VVVFRAGSGTVLTHRITQVFRNADELRFETRGDANPSPDPVLTTGSAIVGRVMFSLPLAGYALAYLSLPSGLLSCVSLIAALLLSGWLLDLHENDHGAAPAPAATGRRSAERT